MPTPDEWTTTTPSVATSGYRERAQWGIAHDRLTSEQATAALGEPLDPIIPADVHHALDRYDIPRIV